MYLYSQMQQQGFGAICCFSLISTWEKNKNKFSGKLGQFVEMTCVFLV